MSKRREQKNWNVGKKNGRGDKMVVECPDCGLRYDDLYRLTYCPHVEFSMSTLVVRGDGSEKVCHSIEEMHQFMDSDVQK
jgi:hypothetical protein